MPKLSCNAPTQFSPLDAWAGRPGAEARVWPSEQMIRLLHRAVAPARFADMTAMDVGCGNGRNAIALAALGCARIIAVDPLNELLQAVQTRVSAAGLTIDGRLGGFPNLPCESASVDLAVCWGVLFVLGGPAATRAALDEVARVLRPGGVLVADWRTEDDGLLGHTARQVAEQTYELGRSAPANLGGAVYSFWDAEYVMMLQRAAGFEIVAMQREEITDMLSETSHSWWQSCAQRSAN
ncbi:MAG: class I SAM-dependent methyltransferase [Planctomycetes bacterium]|nr:class I SAM-dependent methyltransferase [Planctomycetota bacterium]